MGAAALLLAIGLSAAHAEVAISGSFTATQTCPAFQSFRKSSNPGDPAITLAPSASAAPTASTAQLGARCVQWILTRGEAHNIRLVQTRNYVPHQTAFYAEGLWFLEDDLASEFLTAFPQLQIPNQLQRLLHDRQIITTRMEERVHRGGFDIGKHPPEQRRAIAHRFIELDDKLRDIDEHCRALELAERLALQEHQPRNQSA